MATIKTDSDCSPREGSTGSLRRMLHLRVAAGTGGGPEKTILNSPRFIRRHGIAAQVVYLCPPEDPLAQSLTERAQAADCPLTVLPDRGPIDLRIIPQLIKLCRDQRIELVQAHDYKSNLLALIVRRFHRCHLATMLHGWTDLSGRMPLYKRIDQACLKRYSTLICVSKDLVDECARLRIAPDRVHLVHNAIDTETYGRRMTRQYAKQQIQAEPDRFLIGSVGRLSAEKGYLELIACVAELLDQGHAIDLWIAGEGPQRTELEARIAQLGYQRHIRLLGQVANTSTFYQALDLFVLNSIREGLPNVVLEAMAMEVPIVATDIAGVPSLVRPGETGVLLPPASPADLRRVLQDAFVPENRGRWLAFGENARRLVEREFSFTDRMKRVAAIYDQAWEPKRAAKFRRG